MRIRPARPEDAPFIQRLVPRLVEFGPVPGRDREQMIARDRAVIAASLAAPSADGEVFVAEDDEGRLLGFTHLITGSDYYSDSATGHIADLVVDAAAAGQGVGSALVGFAEQWARQRGFAMLTLSVIVENERARSLYRRLGFREDWIRCIKRL